MWKPKPEEIRYLQLLAILIRLVLSAAFLCAIYRETGLFTCISFLLLYVGYEILGSQLLKLSSAIIDVVDAIQGVQNNEH